METLWSELHAAQSPCLFSFNVCAKTLFLILKNLKQDIMLDTSFLSLKRRDIPRGVAAGGGGQCLAASQQAYNVTMWLSETRLPGSAHIP